MERVFQLLFFAVLCFTMVVTAVDVLTKYWPFGQSSHLLCRTVKAAPCLAVYLASLTIVVIALDRYRLIVYSNQSQLTNKQVSLTPRIVDMGLAKVARGSNTARTKSVSQQVTQFLEGDWVT